MFEKSSYWRTGMVVDITGEGIPRDEIDAARARVEALERFVDDPPVSVRVTVRRMHPGSSRPYVADADARYEGRWLAAHAAGPSALEAGGRGTGTPRRPVRPGGGPRDRQPHGPPA